MNVTQVAISPGGTLQANGSRQIRTAAGSPPQQFFREVLYLRFTTGGMAEELVLDPAATVLQAQFRPYDYDARNPRGSLAAAVLRSSGDAVLVEMDTPRRVLHVRLKASKALGGSQALLFYRLDGDTIAEKPTATVTPYDRDLVWLAPASKKPLVQAVSHSGVVSKQGPFDKTAIGVGTPGIFPVDFTDARFALRLQDSSGNIVSLAPDDIAEVRIRSYPTGPRVGIAAPPDPAKPAADPLSEAVFFWQVPGEVGNAVPADKGNVDAGKDLAAALQRHLGGLAPPLPPTVELALVIASDAPCLFETGTFSIGYHLVRESFPAGAAKQVLRFDGERVARQEVTVELPSGATVKSARLELAESFPGHRPVTGSDGLASAGELAEQTGVQVSGERRAAQCIALAEAVTVSGLALGLMALADGTQLQVELQDEVQGRPSGRKLAGGAIRLEQVGRRAWATLLFREVILPSQPHWILLTAASGAAVWLARAGSDALLALQRFGNTTAETRLPGLQALYKLFTPGDQAQDQPPAQLSVGAQDVIPTGPPEGEEASIRTYDLTSAVSQYVAAHPSAAPAVAVPLNFATAFRGLLTVYPPRIEYDS